MIQITQNRMAGRTLALGALVAAIAAMLLLAASSARASTTFTVNSTADHADANLGVDGCFTGYTVDGTGGAKVPECTLRAALNEANYTSGADTINFAIPGTGVHIIAPATQLPTITGPVTINGYSQPGAQPNQKAVGSDAVLKIELNGAEAMGAEGLKIGASNSTVKGLVINNWHYAGVRIDGSGATGNRIAGNFIGTDASGASASGNEVGVRVFEGSYNAIGGTTPAARNVISGNNGGVSIGDGGVTKGNKVLGNYVGTDASGTKDLGNTSDGVGIEDGSGTTDTTVGGATAAERNVISGNGKHGIGIYGGGNRIAGNFIGTDATGTRALENDDAGVYASGTNNIVGGTSAGERNVISANGQEGVTIYDTGATGNKVIGNFIGTDKSGTKALGNADQGVYIAFAVNNTVGGTSAGERNVISANGDAGVLIVGAEARGNKVLGNYIGTDKGGAAPLGNSNAGVAISRAPSNTIGGTTSGTRNVISANGLDGVEIYGDEATGNRILSNSLFANGDTGDDAGIDLGANGPTANDPGDADTGANYLQNFPVLSSARKNAAGATTVRGTLGSTSNSTFRLQFFSNPKGTDEGKTLLGSGTISTDGSGKVSFTFSTKKAIKLGQSITATATGPGGNTSEFSAPRTVVSS